MLAKKNPLIKVIYDAIKTHYKIRETESLFILSLTNRSMVSSGTICPYGRRNNQRSVWQNEGPWGRFRLSVLQHYGNFLKFASVHINTIIRMLWWRLPFWSWHRSQTVCSTLRPSWPQLHPSWTRLFFIPSRSLTQACRFGTTWTCASCISCLQIFWLQLSVSSPSCWELYWKPSELWPSPSPWSYRPNGCSFSKRSTEYLQVSYAATYGSWCWRYIASWLEWHLVCWLFRTWRCRHWTNEPTWRLTR